MFPNPFPLVHVQTVTAPKTVQQSFKECLDRKDVEGAKAIIDELVFQLGFCGTVPALLSRSGVMV